MIFYYDFDTGEKRKSPKEGFIKVNIRKNVFEHLSEKVRLDYHEFLKGRTVITGLPQRFYDVGNLVFDNKEKKLIFRVGEKDYAIKAEEYEV